MEEQRGAELRWGLRFQVGAGDEVWVVGRSKDPGGVPGNKGSLKTWVRGLSLTGVDPRITDSMNRQRPQGEPSTQFKALSLISLMGIM